MAANIPNTVADLKAYLKARGLPTTGSKSELIRLAQVYLDTPVLQNASHISTLPRNSVLEHDDPTLSWVEVLPGDQNAQIPATFTLEKVVSYLSEATAMLTLGGRQDVVHAGTNKPVVKGRSLYMSKSICFLEVCNHPNTGNILIRANCDPSMPKAAEPDSLRMPRVTILPSGDIGLCDCSCTAASDGKCCHVAAVLYLLENLALGHEFIMRVTCTSQSQKWGRGSTRKKDPAVVTEKRYNKNYDPERYLNFNPAPQMGNQNQANHLLNCIQSAHLQVCAFETVLKYEYEDYQITPERVEVLGILVDELRQSLADQLSTAPCDVALSTDSGLHIKGTESQGESEDWHKYRNLRVTGSTLKYFISSVSARTALLWNPPDIGHLIAIKWGRSHEGIARTAYEEQELCNVMLCGFFVSKIDPLFGVSPDGIIVHKDGFIVLEIKCPFTLKDMEFSEVENLPLSKKGTLPFRINLDKSISVKKSHSYYYQIQLSMFVTGAKYAHLFWWTKKWTRLERINLDKTFIEEAVGVAKENVKRTFHVEYFEHRGPRMLSPCSI